MKRQPITKTETTHAAECGWRSWAVVEQWVVVVLEDGLTSTLKLLERSFGEQECLDPFYSPLCNRQITRVPVYPRLYGGTFVLVILLLVQHR
jgi:hypothetical protein